MLIDIEDIRGAAKKLQKHIGNDKEKAREVLRNEGVIDSDGNLTPRYSTSKQANTAFLHETSRSK